MRGLLAVVVGFALFSAAAGLLFNIAGVDPHSPSSLDFLLFALGYGVVVALVSGYLVATIATRQRMRYVAVLAVLMALAATVSLVSRPGQGAVWSQLEMLLVFAPISFVGGRLRCRQRGERP